MAATLLFPKRTVKKQNYEKVPANAGFLFPGNGVPIKLE